MVKHTCVHTSALLSWGRIAPHSYRATCSLHWLQGQLYFLGSLENDTRSPQQPLCLYWKTLVSEKYICNWGKEKKLKGALKRFALNMQEWECQGSVSCGRHYSHFLPHHIIINMPGQLDFIRIVSSKSNNLWRLWPFVSISRGITGPISIAYP